MSVPLDRVRAARRSLSFTWCSVLAAVSLIVVLHVAVAAVRRYLVAGRLRRFFEAPPPPLPPPPGVDVQSPSSDLSAADRAGVDRDAVSAAATTSVRGDERRGHHRHRVPCSRHSTPPSTVDRPSPPRACYSDRQHRPPGFPTTAATRPAHPAARQHRPPSVSHEFPINVERVYYADGIVESNV